MKSDTKKILIVTADPREHIGISLLVDAKHFQSDWVASPREVTKPDFEKAFLTAVILDLDSCPMNNRSIKELASSLHGIPLLCLSNMRFHPDLGDSIRNHIYACLSKPIDPDELNYWLKCIQEDCEALRLPRDQDQSHTRRRRNGKGKEHTEK